MSRDLARLMHALFLPVPAACGETCWRPAVDVCRTATGWVVKFDLSGVRRQEIEVEVCGRLLTVRGQRRDSMQEEACQYYRMEIAYGYYERVIEMPCELQAADITSEYRDGILLIRIRTEGGHRER